MKFYTSSDIPSKSSLRVGPHPPFGHPPQRGGLFLPSPMGKVPSYPRRMKFYTSSDIPSKNSLRVGPHPPFGHPPLWGGLFLPSPMGKVPSYARRMRYIPTGC